MAKKDPVPPSNNRVPFPEKLLLLVFPLVFFGAFFGIALVVWLMAQAKAVLPAI